MRAPAQAEGGPAFAGCCDAPIAVAWLGQAVGKVGRKRREGLASECPIQGGQPHRGAGPRPRVARVRRGPKRRPP